MTVRAFFVGGPADGEFRDLEGDPHRYTFTVMEGGGGGLKDWTASVPTQEVHYDRAEALHTDDVGGVPVYAYRYAESNRLTT